MTRFMEWRDASTTPDGLGTSLGNPWGDWLNVNETTPVEFIDTCYHVLDCTLMAEMAEAIGETADAARFRARFDEVSAAFAKAYIDAEGNIKKSSQSGFALAFTIGLVPPGLKDKMSARFAQEARRFDWHPRTGFVGTPRLPNLDYVFSATTPQRAGVEFDAMVVWGKDENFYEWSPADIIFLNLGAAWKPTDQLRVDARYQLQSFRRRTDDSIVGIRRIPRLKAEYQISRPIFVRVVGEYNSDWQDDLRDDSRTNLPIYIRNASGGYDRAAKTYVKSFRADWLFSYQPTPGTVLFAGYGNTLADVDDNPRTSRLKRTVDGFFLKVSYLFRM